MNFISVEKKICFKKRRNEKVDFTNNNVYLFIIIVVVKHA